VQKGNIVEPQEECPFCKSTEITSGYGYAFGPLGGYTFCENCDELLDLSPDLDGLDDEECQRITTAVDEWRKDKLERVSSPQPNINEDAPNEQEKV
jgi:hypothetical protein